LGIARWCADENRTRTRESNNMPVYNYTTFDDPLATIGTFGNGINDAGQIVGNISNSGSFHGFLLSGGTYTPIDDPLATTENFAEGINNAGQIVGWYGNATGEHGFLRSKDGLYALRSSTNRSMSPGGKVNPQSAVTISGPMLASEAIAGRPHAMASSKANPK